MVLVFKRKEVFKAAKKNNYKKIILSGLLYEKGDVVCFNKEGR